MPVAVRSVVGARVKVPEPDASVVQQLGILRRHLGMDLAWLCRLDEAGSLVIQAHDGDAESFHVGPGVVVRGPHGDKERSVYWNVLSGRLPTVISDIREHPLARTLPAVTELELGAYAGAPVHDAGPLYGMVGAVAHTPRPGLGERHAQIIRLVGDLLSMTAHDLHRMWRRHNDNWRSVRRVLDAGGPRLVYQPILDLRTGRAVGVEALARFPEPPADPQRWFERAGDVGLGVELELAAVRRALDTLPALPAGARLAINTSPTTLAQGLPAILDAVDPSRLIVEVTEHERRIDDPAVLRAAGELRLRGARIAVDDVGAGYSGLSRLVHLQPEVIKLDRVLVQSIDTDPVRRATAIALVYIARELGSSVIAEGIETAGELAAVRDCGIGFGQGHYLARPAARLPSFAEPCPRPASTLA